MEYRPAFEDQTLSRDNDILDEFGDCNWTIRQILSAALKGQIIRQKTGDWETEQRIGENHFWEFRARSGAKWGKWRPTTCYPDPKRVTDIYDMPADN